MGWPCLDSACTRRAPTQPPGQLTAAVRGSYGAVDATSQSWEQLKQTCIHPQSSSSAHAAQEKANSSLCDTRGRVPGHRDSPARGTGAPSPSCPGTAELLARGQPLTLTQKSTVTKNTDTRRKRKNMRNQALQCNQLLSPIMCMYSCREVTPSPGAAATLPGQGNVATARGGGEVATALPPQHCRGRWQPRVPHRSCWPSSPLPTHHSRETRGSKLERQKSRFPHADLLHPRELPLCGLPPPSTLTPREAERRAASQQQD